ncbi:hypothetical protein [Streptomyces sp. NPDC089919]|uniref:hypothetical protein n=1 Tax=Streptomyces sp. NPDC089919 TaxID=3155188 RepID=UPI00343446EC
MTALAAGGVVALSAAMFAGSAVAQAPQTVDRHVVVLVDFRNLSLKDPKKAHDDAARNFFGRTDSLASYYATNSGGRMSVVPAQGDGVLGPFTIDMDDTEACDTGQMEKLARKAVEGVSYDRISIVMHSKYCSNWWGLGSMPGKTTWLHEGAVSDRAAIIHEVGHNLGFAHQVRQVCAVGSFTSCTDDGYSNRTPMGGGGEKKGLSAPELLSQKWLTSAQTSTPTATTTVHLTPLHAPGAAGTRAVDLPLGTAGDRIVVEYRAPDPGTPDVSLTAGVDVYRVPKGKYDHAVMISNVKHDAQGVAGSFAGQSSLADTGAGLALSVTRTGADGADVHIRFGDLPGTASSAPAGPSPSVGIGTGPTNEPGPKESPVSTVVPGRTATTTSSEDPLETETETAAAPTAGATLASTGTSVTALAVTGLVLIVEGAAAAVIARRRRTGHRRH